MRSLIPSFWPSNPSPSFDPFQSLRRDMQDMFGMIERRLPPGEANGTLLSIPSIDLAETKEMIEITAELPGVSEKDISVSLERNRLILSGEKKKEEEQKGKDYYVSERSFGAFTRNIPLDFEPDQHAVDAKFDHGVLKIQIKKPAEIRAKAKEIPVKSGN